jgi:hypothetical protein
MSAGVIVLACRGTAAFSSAPPASSTVHAPPLERLRRTAETERNITKFYRMTVPAIALLRRPPTAAELLRAVASARGWVVGNGLPDEARAGRLLLKDYTDGRLLHCEHPPSQEPSSCAEDAASASSSGDGSEDEEEDPGEQPSAAGTERGAASDDAPDRHAQPHSSSAGRSAALQEGGGPPGEASASEEDQGGASSAGHGAAAAPERASLPADSASELGEADLDLLESLRLGEEQSLLLSMQRCTMCHDG